MNAILVPTDMPAAMALANMMTQAKLVPAHLQRSPGDCLMVIEQAMRWGMSPFAVAQCTSVIQGKLMFEGKLVAAAVQSSGLLEGRLSYSFEGESEKRAIIVSGTIRGESEPRTIRCTLAEAKTSNGMWQKQPDQQLVYYGTRAWARRHTPEVMLGVYSPEEFDAVPAHSGPVIDGQAETHQPPAKRTNDALGMGAPPDPVETMRERLAECVDMDCWNRVAAAWDRSQASAAAAGKTIPPNVLEAVRALLDAKRHELSLPDAEEEYIDVTEDEVV